jgi:pimeloyl-ACP methyl ester carboxylesterase
MSSGSRCGRAQLLAYECAGSGSPTAILAAGYTASGISTYGPVILPTLARRTRVCAYDRAGDGLSDAHPAGVGPDCRVHTGQVFITLRAVDTLLAPCAAAPRGRPSLTKTTDKNDQGPDRCGQRSGP